MGRLRADPRAAGRRRLRPRRQPRLQRARDDAGGVPGDQHRAPRGAPGGGAHGLDALRGRAHRAEARAGAEANEPQLLRAHGDVRVALHAGVARGGPAHGDAERGQDPGPAGARVGLRQGDQWRSSGPADRDRARRRGADVGAGRDGRRLAADVGVAPRAGPARVGVRRHRLRRRPHGHAAAAVQEGEAFPAAAGESGSRRHGGAPADPRPPGRPRRGGGGRRHGGGGRGDGGGVSTKADAAVAARR